VRLAYIDETNRGGFYFVAAVVISDACAQPLDEALRRVLANAINQTKNSATELHGHPMFHGDGDWAGVPPGLRINLYKQAMRAVGEHDVKIFISGVEEAGLKKRYGDEAWHPHDVALRYLLERINDFAKNCGEPALVIADDVAQDDRLRHRKSLATIRTEGTGGKSSSPLPQIIDTIHFAPSHHSLFLQAVDMVAFLHQRRFHAAKGSTVEPREVIVNEKIWAALAPRVGEIWVWYPYPAPSRHEAFA
jgi:hypothetical protein